MAMDLLMRLADTGKRLVDAIKANRSEETTVLATEYLELYVLIPDSDHKRYSLPDVGACNLSVREVQTVALKLKGHQNDSIATLLGMAESTVKTHLRNAKVKGQPGI